MTQRPQTVIECPALLVAAPASGQGKTTVTAALARLLTRQGMRVHLFKTGPDYLDPQILAQASGQDVVPLDLWMAGDAWCRQQLYSAAKTADVILIEGAMGLFDGQPSSADLAAQLGIPIALVMDVKGMAQTAAAMVTGLARFRDDIAIAGLIANRCGSERHRELIAQALPDDIPLLFTVPRTASLALPERHLGLVQASEVSAQLEHAFEAGADTLLQSGALGLVDRLTAIAFAPASPPRHRHASLSARPLLGLRIAIARDSAFSFIYRANTDLLADLGAALVFFSPLQDNSIPIADALWLPGGYPELHAAELAANAPMLASIKQFFDAGKVILAECGGLLYSLERLTDLGGNTHQMAALLRGEAAMSGKRGCQGMQSAPLPEGELRGHAHHRSRSCVQHQPLAYGRRQRHPAPGEAIYREHGLTATYLHLFFPSNPQAIALLFRAQPPVAEGNHDHTAGKVCQQ